MTLERMCLELWRIAKFISGNGPKSAENGDRHLEPRCMLISLSEKSLEGKPWYGATSPRQDSLVGGFEAARGNNTHPCFHVLGQHPHRPGPLTRTENTNLAVSAAQRIILLLNTSRVMEGPNIPSLVCHRVAAGPYAGKCA